jgi:hypothetical protein
MHCFASPLSRLIHIYTIWCDSPREKIIVMPNGLIGTHADWAHLGMIATENVASIKINTSSDAVVTGNELAGLIGLHLVRQSVQNFEFTPVQKPMIMKLLDESVLALEIGGVLVACAEIQSSVPNLLTPHRFFYNARACFSKSSVSTIPSLRRLFANASFEDLRSFYIYPNVNDPMALIPTDPEIANAYFRSQASQSMFRRTNFKYLFNLLITRLGLRRYFQSHILLVAKKSC